MGYSGALRPPHRVVPLIICHVCNVHNMAQIWWIPYSQLFEFHQIQYCSFDKIQLPLYRPHTLWQAVTLKQKSLPQVASSFIHFILFHPLSSISSSFVLLGPPLATRSPQDDFGRSNLYRWMEISECQSSKSTDQGLSRTGTKYLCRNGISGSCL